MNCNDVRDNLSLYIDDELNEEEKKLMDEHLKVCTECSKELEEYRKLIQMLNELPDEEPPAGYCKRLHEKLMNTELPKTEEAETAKVLEVHKKTRSSKFKWVKYGGLAASLALILLVYGLNNNVLMKKSNNELAYDTAEAPQVAPMEPAMGSMPPDMNDGNYEYSIAEEEEEEKAKSDDNRSVRGQGFTDQISLMAADTREMKIIKTGSMYVQTKDYDKFLNETALKIEELGGFIENNNTEVYQVYNDEKLMHGSLRIRVPKDTFDELIAFLEQTTDIRRKSVNESDVTKEYYEKDNKVKNLEVQEQHLRDLFEKATTVEEMLQIENELRRIRTEIDALNISLADINDRASMSTIDLEVEEVKEVNFTLQSEKGVWERAKEGFISTVNGIVRGFGNLIVNIVSSSPVLIPVVLIFVVLLLKIKKYWKKKL
ncbi:MAG: DUF4349 domain-containing protein [Sedimentibacter sp.]